MPQLSMLEASNKEIIEDAMITDEADNLQESFNKQKCCEWHAKQKH